MTTSGLLAGDGLIQEAELQHVMRACMDENGMNFDEDSIEELTHALFQVFSIEPCFKVIIRLIKFKL